MKSNRVFEDVPWQREPGEEDLFRSMLGRVEALREAMPEAPALEGPFAPPPWPRAEMDAMYRLVAGEAGLPGRCPDRRCRRAGRCGGGLGRPEACEPLWDGAAAARLEAACLALVLAWNGEVLRLCERADMLDGTAAALEEAAPS